MTGMYSPETRCLIQVFLTGPGRDVTNSRSLNLTNQPSLTPYFTGNPVCSQSNSLVLLTGNLVSPILCVIGKALLVEFAFLGEAVIDMDNWSTR